MPFYSIRQLAIHLQDPLVLRPHLTMGLPFVLNKYLTIAYPIIFQKTNLQVIIFYAYKKHFEWFI